MKPEDPSPPVLIERADRTANQYRWPPAMARLLGQVSDPEVAARAGVVIATVAKERRRRGIPPFRPRAPDVEWTEDTIALLGEASDKEVAAELGISVGSVSYKRHILGIPAYGPVYESPQARRSARFWTPRRVALLGTAPDLAIARRLGISPHVVAKQRRKRGIPPFKPRPARVVWTAARVRLLGHIPDTRIAEKLGVSPITVQRERVRRGIPPVRTAWKLLGTPDLRRLLRRLQNAEIARRAGISKSAVRRLRIELGIPSPKVWTPQALRDLGRVPDTVLAERLGLKPGTVLVKRLQHGIRFRPARRWTKEEENLIRRLPAAEVARRTGRTLTAVRYRRWDLGIRPPRPNRPWTKKEEDLVLRLPAASAARRTGRSLKAVYHRLEKLGL